MKKVIVLLFAMAMSAFANQPAVTITLTATTPKFHVYTVTFLTDSTAVDSVYIYPNGTTPFNIENIGYEDSLLTVQLTSTETTADSIRFNINYEVSAITSPTTSQYSTAFIDSTSFTNYSPGLVSRFYVRSYAGLNRVLRLFLVENDADKDPAQTITLQIIIPRN